MILKDWQWERYDPDGCLLSNSLVLADVVNRLAFYGLERPSGAVLKLLCEGRLDAICSYRWLKFEHFQRYEVSEYMKFLDRSKWLALAAMLDEEGRVLPANEWGDLIVDLEKLELKDCIVSEWEPSLNRFSYASCPPDTKTFDPNYFEEWCTARDIEITLAGSEIADARYKNSVGDIEDIESDELESPKRQLAQSELLKWWSSKADVRDLLTKDELLALVRAKYPDNIISRDRVRDLAGARKRGPKQFRDESSAK